MAGSGALSSVGAGLVWTDGCARNLSGHGRDNAVAFQLDAAILQRFTGNHKSGNPGFHIRRAETKDFPVANGAAQFANRIELGAEHPVLFGAGEARIHMTIDLNGSAVAASLDHAHGI